MELGYSRWIYLALAIALAAVLAVGGVTYHNTTAVHAAQRQVDRVFLTREAIAAVRAALVDAETGQRGYLITAEEPYLEWFYIGSHALDEHLEDLQRLTGGDPLQRQRAERLDVLAQHKLDLLNEAIIARRDHPGEEGAKAAAGILRTDKGRRAMDEIRGLLREMLETEERRLQQQGDQSVRRIEATHFAILVGGAVAVAVLIAAGLVIRADRQKRHEAELQRRSSDARLAVTLRQRDQLLDQAQDAVYLVNNGGRIVYWNEAAKQLYGYAAQTAVGSDADELLQLSSDTSKEAIQTAIVADEAWTGERHATTADARQVIIEQRRTQIHDLDNHPSGQLVIDIDVTERRRREAQERRSQRLESIGTLAGGIAHDLNNVLAPIIMAARILERNIPGQDRQDLLQTIRLSAHRGAEMIKQLLAFAGGNEGSRESIELRQVLLEVQSILGHTLPKTIQVEVEAPDALWNVVGDATELSQVLMNLSINARDAMPDGGCLRLTAENVLVDGSVRPWSDVLRPGPHVRITVADTGTGISPSIIERVFDPFFTTKDQGDGTGLGLSTSLGIIRGHDGAIHVHSEPGQGTTFAIYLPAQSAPPPADVGGRYDLPRGQGECILVVDDEAALLEMTCATLQSYGYRAVPAADGEQAVALLEQPDASIQLAIVDMMMPGMNGPATVAALHRVRPELPTIASSGLRRPAVGTDQLAGSVGYLPKPFSDEQLLGAVQQALRTHCPLASTSTP